MLAIAHLSAFRAVMKWYWGKKKELELSQSCKFSLSMVLYLCVDCMEFI